MACMDNLNYDQYIDRLSQVIRNLIGKDDLLLAEDSGSQLSDGLEHSPLHLPSGISSNYE